MGWRLMSPVLVIAVLLTLALDHRMATSAARGVEGGGLAQPGQASTTASSTTMVAPPNLDKMVRGGAASVQVGDMMYLPGGYFTMGDHRGRPDEWPAHSVRLHPYYIDLFEVTSAQYGEFVVATGRPWPATPTSQLAGEDEAPDGWGSRIPAIAAHYAWRNVVPPAGTEEHPVLLVSWEDASAYCAWRGKRLPTEAEWEMAARGSDGRTFPWGNEWDASLANGAERWAGVDRLAERHRDAWWAGEGARLAGREVLTLPVGSLPEGRSPCGLFDMAGNVEEWVADWYSDAYYQQGVEKDPQGPTAGERRVVRGGSWFSLWSELRASARRGVHPSVRSLTIGFRCAKDVE